MSCALYLINAADRACPSYYILNHRVDTLSGSMLFHVLDNILDVLKYFGLYRFALQMGTDPIKTDFAFHRCRKFDLERMAVRD